MGINGMFSLLWNASSMVVKTLHDLSLKSRLVFVI